MLQINEAQTFPMELPIIVEDELFLYPFMITSIFLGDDENLKALELAIKNRSMVMVVPSKSDYSGARDFKHIYKAGVIGNIMRRINMPDGRVKILFQGALKGEIKAEISADPLVGSVDIIDTKFSNKLKVEALLNVLKERIVSLSNITHLFQPDLLKNIEESSDANRVCDLILNSLRLKKSVAYRFFIQTDMEKKIFDLIDYVSEEIEANKLEKEIKTKVHSKIEKTNKEYFLKEQLRQIQKELGSDNDKEEEIKEYRKKLEIKKPFISTDAYKEINKQIDKFARVHPDSADAAVVQSYIDWVLEVPFEKLSKKNLSIDDVKKELDKDHYGLEKPKERIVEYFGLRELLELRGQSSKINNGIILCFVGPPGVGKTSLANSIANALKRSLVRIALGGLEDVNELRGHRRTYVGAMPGRITQGLIEAKEMNPVFVLDEIDKISKNFRGDPTAVLLEILDPEQNSKFRDYYLNFDINLSKIIFVATANDASMIPAPLRDRMEFIFLSSYTPQEKYQIAKRYLIPQELTKHGLKNSDVTISDSGLKLIISDYTRESGVRNLRRKLADIFRKIAVEILTKKVTDKVNISVKNLNNYLDKKVYEIDAVDKKDVVGVVNGLAWTSVGGDILQIEAIKIKGKGKLSITGQLGDVMKESAQIAHSVVKVLIDEKKIKVKSDEEQIYNLYDLHIHVPEGATPKDGPSAGITMATAIASILSDQKVKHDIAMTGELTLQGKVLPIGGLKEKLIAAHKAKIKTALIPHKNYNRDLDDIPEDVRKDMQILPVDTIEDVLKLALC
ncbi:MAG: endopeptidase La [Campylobacter sp.]|nr:endopeptidase La [Campylobacter sp.]